MPAATQTYYEILGIAEDATPDDVATARRSMLKAVHPDLATSEHDRVERERLSRMVNDICDTLLDPIARFDYDRSLARDRRWGDEGPPPEPGPSTAPTRAPADPMDPDTWAGVGDDAPRPVRPVLPGLEWLEAWLTWRVAILFVTMLGLSVYLYDSVGGRVLDRIGLHLGRFGSLAAVLLGAVLLVVLCLGVARLVTGVWRRYS